MRSIREIVVAEVKRQRLNVYRLTYLVNACRKCRKRGGWTKHCLACGGYARPHHVSRTTLHNYLTGKADLTSERLGWLLKALGLEVTRKEKGCSS